MTEPEKARRYLEASLPLGRWAEASFRIGHDHAYIQQYIRRGVPYWLSEADRKILVKVYGLDPARLAPPAKSASLMRLVKRYRPRKQRKDQPAVDTRDGGQPEHDPGKLFLGRVWDGADEAGRASMLDHAEMIGDATVARIKNPGSMAG